MWGFLQKKRQETAPVAQPQMRSAPWAKKGKAAKAVVVGAAKPVAPAAADTFVFQAKSLFSRLLQDAQKKGAGRREGAETVSNDSNATVRGREDSDATLRAPRLAAAARYPAPTAAPTPLAGGLQLFADDEDDLLFWERSQRVLNQYPQPQPKKPEGFMPWLLGQTGKSGQPATPLAGPLTRFHPDIKALQQQKLARRFDNLQPAQGGAAAPQPLHLLRAVRLADDAPDGVSRAQARAMAKALGAQQPGAGVHGEPHIELSPIAPYTHSEKDLMRPAQAFKFEADTRAHALLGLPDSVRIREMNGPFGHLYMSQAVARGTFGKCHIAMTKKGELLAVKEFLTVNAPSKWQIDSATGARVPKARKLQPTNTVAIRREIRALQKLSPSTQLFATAQWQGKFYLMMTFYQGRVSELIKQMPSEDRFLAACLALRNVARDLKHVHNLGFVHRDVKWSNVLVDQSGAPVLQDFGLSRRMGANGMYASEHFAGTYFPPETVVYHRGHGYVWYPASDVFTMGAIAGELFLPPTVRSPFAPTFFDDGSVGIAGRADGYLELRRFYDRITDAAGEIHIDRIRPSCVFGKYFDTWRHINEPMVRIVLNYMLNPEPEARQTIEALEELFDRPFANGRDALSPPLFENLGVEAAYQPTVSALQSYRAWALKPDRMQQARMRAAALTTSSAPVARPFLAE